MTLNKLAKEMKEEAEISCGFYYGVERKQLLILLDEREKLREALEIATSLTQSWVMAEQTINCKHTYDQIKNIATEALALGEGEVV